MPRGLCYGTLVDTGNAMFYIGGAQVKDEGLQSGGSIFGYEDAKDSWIEMAQLPSTRHFICTAVLGKFFTSAPFFIFPSESFGLQKSQENLALS